MIKKLVFENMLKTYLTELFDQIGDRKIIILGNRRISGVLCCAIRSMGREIAYFLNPEEDANNNSETIRYYFGKPVYPVYYVLYEDFDQIAVVNSLHYKEVTDPLMELYGLKEEYNYFNLHGYQKVKRWDIFDPTLGYSRKAEMDGFFLHGKERENQLRIVTLGGATTDYSYSFIKSWPEFLHEMLLGKGIDNVIFNGGMNGYTSCEERDRMLRDVPALHPDLVLSLSGECDIGWLMVSKKHPWVSEYYEKKIGGILKQSMKERQENWFQFSMEHLYGEGCGLTDYENWIRNERIIHAMAKALNITYIGFLQPFIFEGNYETSDFEKSWLESFLTEGCREMPVIEQIFKSYQPFYEGVKKLMKEYDYLVDLTDVFDDVSGVYSDGVHYDEIGNYLIAERMLAVIENKHSEILGI